MFCIVSTFVSPSEHWSLRTAVGAKVFHPLGSDHGDCFRAAQELQKGRDASRLRGIGWYARDKDGVVLQLFRQWTGKPCLGLIGDLADLGDAEGGGAKGERHFGNVAARRQPEFRPELVGQSKLFDDLGNMDAGRSALCRVGVNDRLRGEERAFEILDRSYVAFNSGV